MSNLPVQQPTEPPAPPPPKPGDAMLDKASYAAARFSETTVGRFGIAVGGGLLAIASAIAVVADAASALSGVPALAAPYIMPLGAGGIGVGTGLLLAGSVHALTARATARSQASIAEGAKKQTLAHWDAGMSFRIMPTHAQMQRPGTVRISFILLNYSPYAWKVTRAVIEDVRIWHIPSNREKDKEARRIEFNKGPISYMSDGRPKHIPPEHPDDMKTWDDVTHEAGVAEDRLLHEKNDGVIPPFSKYPITVEVKIKDVRLDGYYNVTYGTLAEGAPAPGHVTVRRIEDGLDGTVRIPYSLTNLPAVVE